MGSKMGFMVWVECASNWADPKLAGQAPLCTKRKVMNAEYLSLAIEEAAEVIKAATKILRFGPDRRYPSGDHADETNTEALAMEFGDLLEVVDRLELPYELIERGRNKKRAQLKKWGPQRSNSELDAGLAELRTERQSLILKQESEQ